MTWVRLLSFWNFPPFPHPRPSFFVDSLSLASVDVTYKYMHIKYNYITYTRTLHTNNVREGGGDARAGEDQIVSRFDFHFQFVCVCCCCCVCVASNDAVCGGGDDMTMLLMTKMTIKSAVRSTKEPTGILCMLCVSLWPFPLSFRRCFSLGIWWWSTTCRRHSAVSGRGNYRISFAAPTSCSHTECSPCESAGWGRPPLISLGWKL
jgi:hypothetical protein